MGCVLRVSGTKFDPAKFLASSTLRPYAVFRAGDVKVASSARKHETSGFKVVVSRGSWSDLSEQVTDAVAFLRKHRKTLAKLRRVREVEDVRLDFGLDLRIDRKTTFMQFEYFPLKLVSLAGELGCGLELSIYPTDLEQLARKRARRRKKSTSRGTG